MSHSSEKWKASIKHIEEILGVALEPRILIVWVFLHRQCLRQGHLCGNQSVSSSPLSLFLFNSLSIAFSSIILFWDGDVMTSTHALFLQAIPKTKIPWRGGECDGHHAHTCRFSQRLLHRCSHESGRAQAIWESGEQGVTCHLWPETLHWLPHWAASLQPRLTRWEVQCGCLCQCPNHAWRWAYFPLGYLTRSETHPSQISPLPTIQCRCVLKSVLFYCSCFKMELFLCYLGWHWSPGLKVFLSSWDLLLCLSFFSYSSFPLSKQLKGERIYFSSQFKVHFTVAGESVQKEVEATGSITSTVRRWEERSPFIQSRSWAGNGATWSGSFRLT